MKRCQVKRTILGFTNNFVKHWRGKEVGVVDKLHVHVNERLLSELVKLLHDFAKTSVVQNLSCDAV